MQTKDINKHIVSHDAKVIDILDKLNRLSGEEMVLFVVNDRGKMEGTLTDGDVRRALLNGKDMGSTASEIAHRQFRFLVQGGHDVELIRECRRAGINLLPVLDSCGKIADVVSLAKTHSILPLEAILMAGGRGERLRPMTLTVPKPLLEIDGRAIIDYNIDSLAACGIDDITVCTRYLAEQIEKHFAMPVAGVNVKCVKEETPLGTLGAASLVPHRHGGATIVMNSDLLTTISFEDMYLRHVAENADITVAVIPYQVSVPYAVLTTDGSQVTGIEEKPAYSYYANAGIYIIDNCLLGELKYNTRIDATDFVQNAINAGRRVSFFPINGTWIDIGSPVDFRQAGEIMRHYRNMSDKQAKI